MVKISKYTPYKQKDLRNIIDSIFPIAKMVMNRHFYYGEYYYILDVTAGDAQFDNMSPNILLESAEIFKIRTHLLLFEKNKETYSLLRENMKDKISPYVDITINNNWKLLVSQKIKNRLGFLYFDPYGIGSINDWFLLRKILESNKQMDMLFNISATSLKRFNVCSRTNHIYGGISLSKFISFFNKKYKYIRPYYPNFLIGKTSAHQFIMIFMTNLKNYKPPINFIDITTNEGKSIIRECELTNKEKLNGVK
jgi:hypothetical protein